MKENWLSLGLLLLAAQAAEAQLTYATNNGAITIIGCIDSVSAVTIPGTINGLPVTEIGGYAFFNCRSLTNVTIPNSVTKIGDSAFTFCPLNGGIYFQGNAPSLGSFVFGGLSAGESAYYLPGTSGWGWTFGPIPTALWTLPYPSILNSGLSFGPQTNQFGFTVSWATNLSVIVEACTNLGNPLWQPLQTSTLTNGWFNFIDSQWTNYPARCYRARMQ